MLSDFIYVSAVIFIAMNVMFVLALILKNNSIIDIFWGIGFVIVACSLAIQIQSLNFTQILFGIFLSAWAIRLSLHIFLRNKGHAEDFRYANWRKTWKYFILRSYFQVFMLQGLMMLIISLPVLAVYNSGFEGKIVFTIIGSLIFISGFLTETLADYQLKQFRNNPENKGRIIKSGLWKYSRHPNYFGEALLWWGLWIISLPVTLWYITILSPIVITILLRYVSGVPMLEEKYRNHPEWEAYCNETPVFVPGRRK
jgi:steroid 5-alpha reductase family enzyme